jgi:O-phosphoseryl-tRNA(Sec) kinase
MRYIHLSILSCVFSIPMTQFILALCGLPSSGKSILADAIQKEMSNEIAIVRTDEWRNDQYYADWKPEKEGPVRLAALKQVKKLVDEGKSVIHDDTNYYTSMRHDLLKIALDNRCAFAVIHVSTPLDVALRWNSERAETRIPHEVIERINERFDLPGRRYLWDDSIMEVNMANQDINQVIADIVDSIEELDIAVPEPRLVTSTEFERLDVETRRTVSEFLEKHPHLRRSREVSKIRRNILRKASRRRISVKRVHEMLLEELRKLL